MTKQTKLVRVRVRLNRMSRSKTLRIPVRKTMAKQNSPVLSVASLVLEGPYNATSVDFDATMHAQNCQKKP